MFCVVYFIYNFIAFISLRDRSSDLSWSRIYLKSLDSRIIPSNLKCVAIIENIGKNDQYESVQLCLGLKNTSIEPFVCVRVFSLHLNHLVLHQF